MKTYPQYLEEIFGPGKYQKLTLNAGHDCPNRNGTLGYGGCIYCSNEAFSPAYCHGHLTLAEQLEAGRQFFSRKYKDKNGFHTFRPTPPRMPTSRDCVKITPLSSIRLMWPVWW